MAEFPIPEVYEALNIVMKYYPDNFSPKIAVQIETLLDHCLDDIEDNSDKMLTALFIKSIKQHIGPISVDEHIYLRKFALPQIKLFDLIIKHFPFVNMGHRILNLSMISNLVKFEYATLVDIGMGRGIQVSSLLEMLKEHDDCKLKQLNIIGIEPIKEALEVAEKLIIENTLNFPFKVIFTPVNQFVEEIDFSKLSQNIPDNNEALILNESLTLHHVQESKKRDEFLASLESLKPLQFMLMEPNVDHFEPNFHKRFENCYQHFYHVFKVIDGLDIPKDEQNALKLFFGREIDDIIGKQNSERYERHEPATRWIERLKKAGFVLRNEFQIPLQLNNRSFEIDYHNEGFLGFTHEKETVLAIMHASI